MKNGFRLQDYIVYPQRNVISGPDGEQRVEPKAMRVLLFLAGRPHQVVSRHELLSEIWPETFSGDEALTRCISLLRSYLGSKKLAQRFIETIPKVGYRFTNLPIELENVENLQGTPKALTPEQNNTIKEELSIAVLPFVNMSNDTENEYFSDGITEEILNFLAQIPELRVTSRSSSFFFKNKNILISDIARKLGVRNILEGSVRKFGDKVRVRAQLINAEKDTHLWSQTFEREYTELFALQDEISKAIVEVLKSLFGIRSKYYQRDWSNVTIDAHNEYLKGLFFISRRSKSNIELALKHFTRATELSPDYAVPWTGVGFANLMLLDKNYGSVPLETGVAKARFAIEKALSLDNTLPEVHGIMGALAWNIGDFESAAKSYHKALELNPNYAIIYNWLSFVSGEEYFCEQALELREKAVQLDPMSLVLNYVYAADLLYQLEFEKSEAVIKHALEIEEFNILVASIFSTLRFCQKKYGESLYIIYKIIERKTEDVSLQFAWEKSELLYCFEQSSLAEQLINLSDFKFLLPLLNNDHQSLLDSVKPKYPLNENDSIGLFIRAYSEAVTLHYEEAVKYFEKTNYLLKASSVRIVSYQQSGNISKAIQLLEERKLRLKNGLALNREVLEINGDFPIDIVATDLEATEIDYLEGNIVGAISHLKQAVDKGHILPYSYKYGAMFNLLREHRLWPELLKKSNQILAKELKIFESLKKENKSITSLL